MPCMRAGCNLRARTHAKVPLYKLLYVRRRRTRVCCNIYTRTLTFENFCHELVPDEFVCTWDRVTREITPDTLPGRLTREITPDEFVLAWDRGGQP